MLWSQWLNIFESPSINSLFVHYITGGTQLRKASFSLKENCKKTTTKKNKTKQHSQTTYAHPKQEWKLAEGKTWYSKGL